MAAVFILCRGAGIDCRSKPHYFGIRRVIGGSGLFFENRLKPYVLVCPEDEPIGVYFS